MRLRPEIDEGWRERMDKSSAEEKRVLGRFGIARPRCGFSCNAGWLPTVERALEKMVAVGWDRDLHQVKQKFCGLRIYIGAGSFDDIDNPVKKFIREPLIRVASSDRVPGKIRRLLWSVIHSRLLSATRPSAIAQIINEAERECDDLCEVCGKEREKKGFDTGMALCNECGVPAKPFGEGL